MEEGKQYTVQFWMGATSPLSKKVELKANEVIDEMKLLDLLFNHDDIDVMIQQTKLQKGANPICWIDDKKFSVR